MRRAAAAAANGRPGVFAGVFGRVGCEVAHRIVLITGRSSSDTHRDALFSDEKAIFTFGTHCCCLYLPVIRTTLSSHFFSCAFFPRLLLLRFFVFVVLGRCVRACVLFHKKERRWKKQDALLFFPSLPLLKRCLLSHF